MSRLPGLTRDRLGPLQAEVYNAIAAGPRGGVRGPFPVLLHSPDLARNVERLGAYVRFRCALPPRLRELAIAIVAAHWHADYEWHAHAGIADHAGIAAPVLEAIAQGRRPPFEQEGDRVVHDFVTQLLRAGRVEADAFARAHALLGDAGTVDLTALAGYYSLLAMILNAFEVPAPADAAVPWRMPGSMAPGA